MEIPEAVPYFLHYPHNYDVSHILQGESELAPCQCNKNSCKVELRHDATPRFCRSNPGLSMWRYDLPLPLLNVPWTFLLIIIA